MSGLSACRRSRNGPYSAHGRPDRPQARSLPRSGRSRQSPPRGRALPAGRGRAARLQGDRIAAGQADGPGHVARPIPAVRHGEHQRHAARARDVDHRLRGQLHGGKAGIDVCDLGAVEPHPRRRPGPLAGRAPPRARCSGSGTASAASAWVRPRSVPAKACDEDRDVADAAGDRQTQRRDDAVDHIGKAAIDEMACGRDLRRRAAIRDGQRRLQHRGRAQAAFGDEPRPGIALLVMTEPVWNDAACTMTLGSAARQQLGGAAVDGKIDLVRDDRAGRSNIAARALPAVREPVEAMRRCGRRSRPLTGSVAVAARSQAIRPAKLPVPKIRMSHGAVMCSSLP